jgi:hypothetical protein
LAIRVGTVVELRGAFLRSDAIRVEIDGTAVPAASVSDLTDERLRFPVPTGTPAGPRLVRVVHDLGAFPPPSTTVVDSASDPHSLLVRPEITAVSKAAGNVRVDVATPIGPSQTMEIVLNRQGGTESFVRPGNLVNPTRVRAPMAGLVAGTYLVGVRIDGVESVPDPPGFAFPTVTSP